MPLSGWVMVRDLTPMITEALNNHLQGLRKPRAAASEVHGALVVQTYLDAVGAQAGPRSSADWQGVGSRISKQRLTWAAWSWRDPEHCNFEAEVHKQWVFKEETLSVGTEQYKAQHLHPLQLGRADSGHSISFIDLATIAMPIPEQAVSDAQMVFHDTHPSCVGTFIAHGIWAGADRRGVGSAGAPSGARGSSRGRHPAHSRKSTHLPKSQKLLPARVRALGRRQE